MFQSSLHASWSRNRLTAETRCQLPRRNGGGDRGADCRLQRFAGNTLKVCGFFRGSIHFCAMAFSAPARLILAGLISIGLQLCCCNFEVLLGGCCGEQTDSREASVALSDGHDHSRNAQHEHGGHDDGDHHHGQTPTQHDDGQPSKPCGPCDHHNDGGCSCGTHDKAPSQIAKLDLPMTVVAVLPTPTSFIAPLTISAPRYAGLHGVSPPRTTLLQQHCALIV